MIESNNSPMIQVQNLVRRYGKVPVLDGLSFSVAPGEIVGLLGPNGAGKTTTLRILACYLPASSGDVFIAGKDVRRQTMDVRRKVGYLPENVPLYSDMRVREYLRFRGALKGLKRRHLRVRVRAVLEQCDLEGEAYTIIGRLSKGFRQRVGLADSLLHEPDCLILDEPTIGLDPNQIRQVRELIKRLAPAHTVLVSTHILSEAEMLCDRVLILNRGDIIASDTPAALLGDMKGNERITAEIKGPLSELEKIMAELQGVVHTPIITPLEDDWVRVQCQGEYACSVREKIFRTAAEAKWSLRELSVQRRHLEDVFSELTAGTMPTHRDDAQGGSHA